MKEVTAYRTKSENLQKTLLEKALVMKATTRSLVDLESSGFRLKTERRFLINMRKGLLSCSAQTMNDGQIADKLLKIFHQCS